MGSTLLLTAWSLVPSGTNTYHLVPNCPVLQENSEKSEHFGNIGFELDRKFDVNFRNKMGTEI